jgi:hypothetical protein
MEKLNNYKVSINANDNLTGEFTGGKEYFETEAEAVIDFKKIVQEALKYNDCIQVFLVDQSDNEILASFDTTGI